MQENKIDGHIVNMNSVVGHMVPILPNQNLYPASKHAVTAFTETLRLDLMKLGSKIRVSVSISIENVVDIISLFYSYFRVSVQDAWTLNYLPRMDF